MPQPAKGAQITPQGHFPDARIFADAVQDIEALDGGRLVSPPLHSLHLPREKLHHLSHESGGVKYIRGLHAANYLSWLSWRCGAWEQLIGGLCAAALEGPLQGPKPEVAWPPGF